SHRIPSNTSRRHGPRRRSGSRRSTKRDSHRSKVRTDARLPFAPDAVTMRATPMVNRKLIRPNLAEMKERFSPNRPPSPGPGAPPREREAPQPGVREPASRRRQVPPENTSAEAFYYVKQMTNRTPMVVVLDTGDELRGHIEWYDRNCI